MKSDRVYESFNIIIETLSDDKGRVMCRKELDVLRQALQRLDKIDNAKPSEALKGLENMVDTYLVENKNKIEVSKANNYDCELLEKRRQELENYKQALLKAQENEKENAKYKQLEDQIGCSFETVVKAFQKYVGWTTDCDFGYDNIPDEYETYKDDDRFKTLSYDSGLIYIAIQETLKESNDE